MAKGGGNGVVEFSAVAKQSDKMDTAQVLKYLRPIEKTITHARLTSYLLKLGCPCRGSISSLYKRKFLDVISKLDTSAIKPLKPDEKIIAINAETKAVKISKIKAMPALSILISIS